MMLALYVLATLGIYVFLGLCAAFAAAGAVHDGVFFSRMLLYFFEFLPPFCASGLLVGYSFGFGKLAAEHPQRFSPLMLRCSKTVLAAGFICTVICFFAAEIGRPFVRRQMQFEENRRESFAVYCRLAERYMVQSDPDYERAEHYIDMALLLFPADSEAAELKNEIAEKNAAVQGQHSADSAVREDAAAEEIISVRNEMQFDSADFMQAARAAAASGNWFDAHYYAEKAASLCLPGDGNQSEARQLANEAWRMLSAAEEVRFGEPQQVFAEKVAGYKMLSKGDFLGAYFVYHTLERSYPNDPDIQRYCRIAQEELEKQYFFSDEMNDMQLFEQYRNVRFVCPKADKGRDVVFCAGISSWKKGGGLIHYFRDFYVYSYDKNGRLLHSIRAPLAKMYAAPENMFPWLPLSIDIDTERTFVPYVLLKSVDRDYRGIETIPVYTQYAETNDAAEYSFQYVMPIPYADFQQVCSASFGAQDMPLMQLINFAERADDFGYSAEVFEHALVSRTAYPFILMIIFVWIAVFGWNYRMAYNSVFKFKWIPVIPVFTLVAFALFDGIMYLQNVLYYALIGFFGTYTFAAVMFFYALLLLFAAVRFAASRGK